MTREEALKIVRKMVCNIYQTDAEKEALGTLIPELKESEDERIIEEIKFAVMQMPTERQDTKERCIAWLEKQKEQKPVHFELKAGKWYICHRAFCCRADHLTVKEGERFQCEKDGIVKGFVIKEPEKYFKECSAPAPMEDEQKEQKPKFYPGDVIKCTSTGSLWVRCKDGDNIRSDGHTACIGGGYELASKEEAVQFFQELNENGYQWDCIKSRPMKRKSRSQQSGTRKIKEF